MSQLGLREEPAPRPEKSGYLWWPTASVPAACIFASQAQQRAASSAKQITVATAISHASHWIFIPSSRRRPRSLILISITRSISSPLSKNQGSVWEEEERLYIRMGSLSWSGRSARSEAVDDATA